MNLNKRFLVNLSLTDISFVLLGLAIALVTFITAGISMLSLALVSPVVLLLVYLRHKTEGEIVKLPTIVYTILGALVLLSFVSIFKSYNVHQSVVTFLWLILSIIAGVEASAMVKEEKGLSKFSNIVIITAIISVISGIYLYFTFDDYSNLRFISTFFQPNPFAGFLLLPLSFLLPLFVSAIENKKRILYGILSTLALSAFILTVSRGAMTIFAFVWIFILALALIKKEYKIKISHVLNVVFIIALSFVLSVVVYKIKMSYAPAPVVNSATASDTNNNTGIFAGGATKREAVSSRFQYMKTAIIATKDNMLSGVGIGAYKEAELKYRDNVIYQTNDPHNLYLRIFSEVGVLGGLCFLSLIVMLGIFTLYKLWKNKFSDFSVLEIGLVAGTFAIILHNVMEVDWYFPANMMLSIIALFVLYSVLNKNNQNVTVKKGEMTRIIFMIVGFVVAFVSILIFLGDNAGMDGPYLARKNKNEEAVSSFQKGLSYDKYNPDVLSGYSNYLLTQSKNITDVTQKKGSLNEALSFMDRAIAVKPHDADLFSQRADIYTDLGNEELAQADLKNAIENNKTLGLDSYLNLGSRYMQEKKYEETVAVVDSALKYYPVGIFQDTFWANQDKGMMKFSVVVLESMKASVLEKLGRKDEAKKAGNLIKLY